MKERTICCSSLSKTYSITGWRLGYTMAVPEITDRIKIKIVNSPKYIIVIILDKDTFYL